MRGCPECQRLIASSRAAARLQFGPVHQVMWEAIHCRSGHGIRGGTTDLTTPTLLSPPRSGSHQPRARWRRQPRSSKVQTLNTAGRTNWKGRQANSETCSTPAQLPECERMAHYASWHVCRTDGLVCDASWAKRLWPPSMGCCELSDSSPLLRCKTWGSAKTSEIREGQKGALRNNIHHSGFQHGVQVWGLRFAACSVDSDFGVRVRQRRHKSILRRSDMQKDEARFLLPPFRLRVLGFRVWGFEHETSEKSLLVKCEKLRSLQYPDKFCSNQPRAKTNPTPRHQESNSNLNLGFRV